MPRKYRSPSPLQRRHSNDDYERRERKTKESFGRENRDRKYRSPSPPVRRTRKYSPSPVRRNSKRNNRKYYSDSESESDSSESYSESDSEERSDSESDSTDDSEYTSSSSESGTSTDSDDERTKSSRSRYNSNREKPIEMTKRNEKRSTEMSKHTNRENKEREEIERNRDSVERNRKQRDTLEHNDKRRRSSQNDEEDNDEDLFSMKEKPNRNENSRSRKMQNEEDDEQEITNETGKKYNGPPRYLVISVDGQLLEQKKIYTSNTGPKNAAQKAFNRLCSEMNKKMEITVRKLDDTKGKVMTYFFKKEELNPPIEREIGGRKVIYRHKTVSC